MSVSVNLEDVPLFASILVLSFLRLSPSSIQENMFLSTPFDISIETFGGRLHTLIPRNTPLPTYGECVVSTVVDDQRTVVVKVWRQSA